MTLAMMQKVKRVRGRAGARSTTPTSLIRTSSTDTVPD
jgi:hypothetical protein